MKKKGINEKAEKVNIEVSDSNRNNQNVEEKNNSIKILGNKSKSAIKKNKKKNDDKEVKELEVILEKKYITYNLDFIYRREKYTLKNIHSDYLVSRVRKLISKKLSVDINLIHIYYLDKEVVDNKLNVYDMIQNNKIKYLEVKKESPINENVISLNTNVHLIYKVRCKGIQNVKDFIEKIETFFRERCLDKHYLCEPIGNNTYDVSFSCDDNRFQFKRYMMIVKRLDNNYINTNYQFLPIDRNEIFQPKFTNLESVYRNSESIFINKGPYMTYEEIQKRNEKEEKKKWISKNDFVYKK
jgi:hypothetical protein